MLQRVERTLSIQKSLKEKKKLEQEKSDFYNMLSHDLKNPITAVIGSIDIMREGRLGPVNSEQQEYLQSAIDSCNEIVTMIDNLLDVQRFEADRIPLALSSCNASEIAASAVQRFLRAAEQYDISLTLNTEDASSQIVADRNIMGRVFANLLVNAIKFTPEGGTIVVSTKCIKNSQLHRIAIPEYVRTTEALCAHGCCVKLSVTDSGEGIPAEDLGRIFERYTQSHNATVREKGGAGLGLAFCKMAVERFNGVIWAENTPEYGSKFIILLPCDPGGSSGRTKP
jgi:signal transduction histidine kinase